MAAGCRACSLLPYRLAPSSPSSLNFRICLARAEVLSASAPEFTPPGSTGAWKQSQQPQHEAKRDERAVYKPQRQRQKQQKQQGGSQEKENRPNEAGAGELRTRKDRRGGERVAPKPGLRVRPPSQKRNTVNFTPTTARPDLRLVLGERGQSYGSKPTPWDCVLVPGFAAERHDMTVYENLLAEIKATGRDDIFCLWHGDSHVIANDRKGWKGNCPTFDRLVKQVSQRAPEAAPKKKAECDRIGWVNTCATCAHRFRLLGAGVFRCPHLASHRPIAPDGAARTSAFWAASEFY